MDWSPKAPKSVSTSALDTPMFFLLRSKLLEVPVKFRYPIAPSQNLDGIYAIDAIDGEYTTTKAIIGGIIMNNLHSRG